MTTEAHAPRWRSIPHLLLDAAERLGEQPAIVDGAMQLSHAGLRDAVMRAAQGLLARRVQPGHCVALWAPNGWQWVVAALAVQSVGAVVVPLNTRYKPDEVRYILERSGARLVFVQRNFLGGDYVAMLREAAPAAGSVACITFDEAGADHADASTWAALLQDGAAIDAQQVHTRIAALGPQSPCDLMFTSGTTGHPKGVLGRHGQVLKAAHDFAVVGGMGTGERHLIVNPFFHALGYKLGWLLSLTIGATTYPQAVFDPARMLALVQSERITILPGPPTIYQALLAVPGRRQMDLRSLRFCMTGATTLPPSLIDGIRTEFGFETMLTGYGLTECCGLATMTRPGDATETICQTSGRAVPGVEISIAGVDGQPMAPGEMGEIRVRGYNVMDGYLGDPGASAQALTADGWLLTGDLGSLDAQGNLRIEGRLKDMYIVGGFNAYPAEIENQLLQHQAVAEASVVGVPDARLGEVGVAFIVRRPQADAAPLTAEALLDWARQRMANYKLPRAVHFVEQLPRNASGKILKTVLRETARRASTEAQAGTASGDKT